MKGATSRGKGVDHFGGGIAMINEHERIVVVAIDHSKRESFSNRIGDVFYSISKLGGGLFARELKEVEKWRRRGWPPQGRE
ncbi:unannotated protein [freshwater metagenome]|uniref:Unannotated protein n=1 Tax=freshwater metagenome TaxID=449393 RepID=A0A6J6RUC3_9ZZZZ